MQFISNGPDVPDELLRLHEEGEVVFFCGAGISMGAGLPDFKGLVKRVWKEVGYNPSFEEKRLNLDGRCDVALELLGNKLNDAITMRNGVATVLSRYREKNGYDRVHKALLALSQTRDEVPRLHLVTTNFDRLFEKVRQDLDCGSSSYIAPLIPVPKKFNWDGIVYLHGLLPDCSDEASLKNLVMTSGDFGRAYLTERWAARFVSELFRKFVVCFVGYSLADPVMRYIADAINADNAEGEETKPIYMFIAGDGSEGLNRNKSIKLIHYSSENGHAALNKTLEEWANTYSSGANGKEAIIDANADIDPARETDYGFVGQVVWALSDKDGVGAQRFAQHNPVPSLSWAKVLMSQKVVVPVVDKKDRTQLLRLSGVDNTFDVRQSHLWNWLLRHLTNPNLVWPVLREGYALHPEFKRRASYALMSYLGNNSKKPSESSVRPVCENNNIHPVLYRLWRLILAGKVVSNETRQQDSSFLLLKYLKSGGLDYSVLRCLRECLTPVIYLEKDWCVRMHPDDNDACLDPVSYFSWDLDLPHGIGSREYLIKEIRKSLDGKLSEVFDCVESALQDGLDALCCLDENAEVSRASFDVISIEDHPQNKYSLHTWRYVVEMLRDAWLELTDKNKARLAFNRWIASKHIVFQRLALFAAKCTELIDPHDWFKSLIANHGFLLWSSAAKREVSRLLATTAKFLSANDYIAFANVIADGPPPCMYMSLECGKANDLIYRKIWLRLEKIKCREHVLPEKAQRKLDEIYGRHPKWSLSSNNQEEFLSWSYGSGDPDFEAETQHVSVPESLSEMVKWLSADIAKEDFELFNKDDNWLQLCREKPEVAFAGLDELSSRNEWNVKRIVAAFSVWREDALQEYGCQFVGKHVLTCPPEVFKQFANEVALWCEEAVKNNGIEEELLVKVARRIFSMTYEYDTSERRDSIDNDPIFDAINHPVGRITEAMLDGCFEETVHKGDGIGAAYMELFSYLCTTPELGLRHGRVVIVSRIVAFYFADERWTRKYIFPLLDWGRDYFEVRAAWCGFLWTRRPYLPLMQEIWHDFLQTAEHIGELKKYGERYCSFLTIMGLWHVAWCRKAEYKTVFANLPLESLAHCAETLKRHQTMWFKSDERKMDKRLTPERLWTKDVSPFIRRFWPKDVKKLSKEICGSFAELVVGTGKEFPTALKSLNWILKSAADEDDWNLHVLKNSTRCLQDFPEESLDYLMLVAQNIKWGVDSLSQCLAEIIKVRPELEKDRRYLKLSDIVKRQGNMI